MARGGRVLRRRATAPAEGFSRKAQAGPIMREPVSCNVAAEPFVPCEAEVLKAVASLCNDGLRPYSRILRKRLAEQAQEFQAGLPGEDGDNNVKDCDAGKLRALCEASVHLRVEAEDWGEWSAVLVDREPNFIDIYDPVDNYPQELWTAAENYFKSLGESSDLALAGGRYASARALAQRQLPFLEGYSLGQICHITQLAISQRKLLGYFNGAIVPYELSTSMLKCRCAQQQRPVVDPPVLACPDGPLQFQVADWDTARQKLREILDSAALHGANQVPLSNVKRLFRSVFQMELSETALGHSKLSDLLQDPRFSDICSVQLQDRGYAVVPVFPVQTRPSNSDDFASGASMRQVTPERSEAQKQESPEVSMQTPVRTRMPPLTITPPPPRTIRRSNSMPDEVGDGKTTADEYVDSSDRVDDSTCSTARDRNDDSGGRGCVLPLARMDSALSEGGLRNLRRMDSNLSENNGWVSPHRGAGAELRAELQRRLCRSETGGVDVPSLNST
mmetsp:Transcript_59405/g.114655  ORF Transcript_59405/g.114655 Transcript_59405/m.114655 type:complete len:504 (+) Transcript_59405:121-1632(+)